MGDEPMNKEHYGELVALSQEIYNDINQYLYDDKGAAAL